MMNHINQLIELNLRFLYEHPHQQAELKDFALFGKLSLADAQVLAEIMELKNLIERNADQKYQLNQRGIDICEQGGWMNHLKENRDKTPTVSLKKTPQDKTPTLTKLYRKLSQVLSRS